MARLNQIIAIENGTKTRAFEEITKAHQSLQKPNLLTGISRTYRPRDEEGEQLPSESTKVQLKAATVVDETAKILTKLFDVTATREWANCSAKASVVVEGKTLVADVPVTYLLFLEKQLVNIHTFIAKLPVLDASETWNKDDSQDVYANAPVETVKTKKTPRNHVKAAATEHHPAQVELYYEDIPVGNWRTVKFSGALPAKTVNDLVERVERLQEAVKFAREEANAMEAPDKRVGEAVFAYLFQPAKND